jgi:hypothetical protein
MVTERGGGGEPTVNVHVTGAARGFPSCARMFVSRVATYVSPCVNGAVGVSDAVFVASSYDTVASIAPPASVPPKVPRDRTLNVDAEIVAGLIGREKVARRGRVASTFVALAAGAVEVTVGAGGSPSGTATTSVK